MVGGFFFGFETVDSFGEREGGPKALELLLNLLEFFGVAENDVTPPHDFGAGVSCFDEFIHGKSLR
ncbi:MAG: hypothetical protein ACJA16_004496 [Akkermansiaceae bacterium]